MEPFSEERTQGPSQIPSAVVLLTETLSLGFLETFFHCCVECKNVMKSKKKKSLNLVHSLIIEHTKYSLKIVNVWQLIPKKAYILIRMSFS